MIAPMPRPGGSRLEAELYRCLPADSLVLIEGVVARLRIDLVPLIFNVWLVTL